MVGFEHQIHQTFPDRSQPSTQDVWETLPYSADFAYYIVIALKRCYAYITIFLYSYIHGVTLCQFLITVICRKGELHSQPSSRATARFQCDCGESTARWLLPALTREGDLISTYSNDLEWAQRTNLYPPYLKTWKVFILVIFILIQILFILYWETICYT